MYVLYALPEGIVFHQETIHRSTKLYTLSLTNFLNANVGHSKLI